MNDPLSLVWAYVLENGKLTNGKWGFYAGNWESVTPNCDWRKEEFEYQKFLNKVKQVGVNWNKTGYPLFESRDEFTDTFHDAESTSTLLGTIVLNDDTSYMVGTTDAEKHIVGYIDSQINLEQDKVRAKKFFGE